MRKTQKDRVIEASKGKVFRMKSGGIYTTPSKHCKTVVKLGDMVLYNQVNSKPL